jgi:regulator of protease activity HflC (stomatin/prohibitin superfamily)
MIVKTRRWALLLALLFVPLLSGCFQDVPAGSVGVKIYKLGGAKGVDHEVLGVGRYWIGWNESLELFPTSQQQYTWTASTHEGRAVDESFTFQTAEGVSINTDVGVAYQIDPINVGDLFQKFRQGPEQITNGFLRNIVRDDLNKLGAHDSLAGILGAGKQRLFDTLQKEVAADVAQIGLKNLRLFTVGEFRLPENVYSAINSKIEANQRAQQAQNELAVTQAEVAKAVAKAEGDARAEVAQAAGEAKANQLRQSSLTPILIQWQIAKTWDGKLPQVQGGNTPIISLK